MKVILWQLPDGSIVRTQPGDAYPRKEGESEDDYLDRIAAQTLSEMPQWKGWKQLPHADVEELKKIGRWRNCWRHDGKKVYVDLDLAKEQRAREIREAMATALPPLPQKMADEIAAATDLQGLEAL